MAFLDFLHLQPIHFLRPFWWLALIPSGVLFYMQRKQSLNSWSLICDQTLWKALSIQGGKKLRSWQKRILALSLLFMVIALSGPSWSHEPTPLYQTQQAQVIVFDLSTAMSGTDLKPDRLSRTRYKTLDLLKALNGSQTGMVAFAGEAYIVSPLTYDTQTIMALVPSLKPNIMPAQGHNIAAGLLKAKDLFQQAGIPAAQEKTVILLTASPVSAQALTIAKQLKEQHIHIDIIGMATRSGSPIVSNSKELQHDQTGHITISKLDQTGLNQLAHITNGMFLPFSGNNNDLNLILSSIKQATKQQLVTEQTNILWHDQGRWFLLVSVILLLLLFRRDSELFL